MLIWLFSALIGIICMGTVTGAYLYMSAIYPWAAFNFFVAPMAGFMFVAIVIGVRQLILKVYERRP